jgi:hypothetical protein
MVEIEIESPKSTLNQRINELIDEKGIMKSKLAGFLGVTDAAIQNWTRTGGVRHKHLERMLEFFKDIERNWLFFGTGPKYRYSGADEDAKSNGEEIMTNNCSCIKCIKNEAIIEELHRILEMKDRKIEQLSREIGELTHENESRK